MTDWRTLFLVLMAATACSSPSSGTGNGAIDGAFAGDDIVFAGTDAASADADAQAAGATDTLVAADVQHADVPAVPDVPDSQATVSECLGCLEDNECATGWFCAQFQGSSFCAKDCATGACGSGDTCSAVSSAAGDEIKVCVPTSQPCAGPVDTPDASPADSGSTDAAGGADSNGLICGSLVGPDVPSCCKCAGKSCSANGCYGGWFCNVPTCKCNPPPNPSACGGAPDAGSPDSGPVTPDVATTDTSSTQSITAAGGTLASLDFAIVGDTRPPNKDDIGGYPTAIITQIFKDVQSENPPLPFVITTGDYQFSSPNSSNASAQLDLYLKARGNYTGTVFYTLGNHECTGATNSNCGSGNADGVTQTYTIFLQKMLAPLGVTLPWYATTIQASDGSWTAKFVFVAANAWSSAQATWLEAQLAKPTTYTFVVRHEGTIVTTTAGVPASDAILAKHPYTLLLVGHTHTFAYYAAERQVVTGNGGAPLTGSINYGYTVLRQRADKALVVTAYDYATHGILQTFVVKPDGTPTK